MRVYVPIHPWRLNQGVTAQKGILHQRISFFLKRASVFGDVYFAVVAQDLNPSFNSVLFRPVIDGMLQV